MWLLYPRKKQCGTWDNLAATAVHPRSLTLSLVSSIGHKTDCKVVLAPLIGEISGGIEKVECVIELSCVCWLVFMCWTRVNILHYAVAKVTQPWFVWSCQRRALLYARLASQRHWLCAVSTGADCQDDTLGQLRILQSFPIWSLGVYHHVSAECPGSRMQHVWQLAALEISCCRWRKYTQPLHSWCSTENRFGTRVPQGQGG